MHSNGIFVFFTMKRNIFEDYESVDEMIQWKKRKLIDTTVFLVALRFTTTTTTTTTMMMMIDLSA